MSVKEAKNKLGGIANLYSKWGHKSFLFTLVCIIWLVWRVSTKPTRIGYPCSQFAIWQIVLFYSSASTPFLALVHKCISFIRGREYMKVARIVLITVVVFGSFTLHQNYQEKQLRIRGSGTIPASSLAISSSLLTSDLDTTGHAFEFPETISTDHAVVSFNHDPLISYGTSSPPYDPASNLAYDFVWETVERLDLGSHDNPLDDLISTGDTVLIKPNWVDFGPGVFTRPEVVRPLIDMAINGGATKIYVGDGSASVDIGETVMSSANYTAMVTSLDPTGTFIQTVNLNKRDYGWHWVYLSSNSSFAGSDIEQWQLGTGSGPLFEHKYYFATDNQSVTPSGNVTGWYAVNDHVLDADVIINVSKMKTHEEMVATMSIKNLVGLTLCSTLDDDWYGERIAHHPNPVEDNYNYFTNEIFWRAILDMNKIVLYADKDGVLQPTQQRSYLNVVDGIEAMEKSQHHEYGGGTIFNRHVVLASVDPAAVDTVGCRIMGYDYTVIPSIANAGTDAVHPIGTNDPEDIVIIGDNINSDFDHVFTFSENWDDDAGSLPVTDITPPTINTISRQDDVITADISDGLVAYVLYETGGVQQAQLMSKAGNIYSVTVPGTVSDYRILAQDVYLNTIQGEPSFVSVTITDNGDAGLNFGALNPAGGRQPEAASPSVMITIAVENSDDIAVYLKGTDFTGTGIININNAFYFDTGNAASALAMSSDYGGSAWKTLGPGESLNIYHWLSIPAGTPAGRYTGIFTYKAKAVTAP